MQLFVVLYIFSLLNLLVVISSITTREETMYVCSQTETVNLTLFSGPSASLAQCVTQCLEQPNCVTGHICTADDGTKTCSLGSDWPPGTCNDLLTEEQCSSFKLANPCQHDGILNPDRMSCTCTHRWYDQYCHRHRYDCSEAPPGIRLAVLQPKGYHKPFLVPCISPRNMVLGFQQRLIQPGELNVSWATYKEGFSIKDRYSQVIGLEYIHALTQQGEYRLTVNLNWAFGKVAVYDNFTLHDEDSGYAFSYGRFRPDLSDFADGFAEHANLLTGSLQGVPFSTMDRDPHGCVATYGAGWWYDALCGPVILYSPLDMRGMWPSINATRLVKVPTLGFALELVRYY